MVKVTCVFPSRLRSRPFKAASNPCAGICSSVNEFDFICRLREQIGSRHRSPRLSVGIGDDAAVIRQYSDRDFVLTTDLLVEGIDFHPQTTPPQLLGQRALAV